MSSQTVVDVVISGTTATVVDAQVDGITTVAGAPQVTNVSGQIPDLGVTTSYLAGQGEILSLTNDIANLRANVIITGQTLTDEIGVLSGVLISTGNYLESNILTLSGDLIASGNNLDSLRDILSGNLITTGRVLEGQIQNSTIDISALQTATGTLQDQKFDKAGGTLSGNVTPSSSGTLSLGTADFPFKSGFFEDLTVSNNTLYVGEIAITATDAGGLDFESASGTTFFKDVSIRNLSVTGTETIIDVDNLAIKDNKIILNSGESGAGISLVTGGIIIDRGTLTDADLLFNEANDRFEFNFPLALEGNLAVTANQTGTYADAGNLITTGQTLTSEINTVSGLIIDNDGDITALKTATGVLKTFTDDNAANLITTGQTLTTNINTVSTNLISTGSVVDDISGNLITTGQTLTSEIGTVSGLITDNDGDITALKTATGVLKTSTDANTSNLITTGNFLTSEINIVSGLAGGSVINELSGDLITTGQTLQVQITSNDSDISTLTSNLVTTGQTLTSEIATVSGIAEAHTDVTALSGKVDDISGNLIITGRTLTTDINTVSANLISTGAIIDDVSGNLITTGQTLQTQITSNDGDISTLTSNLITTGQTLTSEIIIVSGLTTGSASDPALSGKVDTLSGNLITTGQTLQTQITSNDGDISTLTSNVITTGQTLTSEIAIVSGIAEAHTDVSALSGKVDDISGNLITTGQTLQTQITSNDTDISNLTANLISTGTIVDDISGNLITTGQTLQTQITSNDSEIAQLQYDVEYVDSTLTTNLNTTGQTLTTNINTVSTNLISTGSIVDDISGNLIATGQTLQTQITSNDGDITTLTSNLITTGQTLTSEIAIVSGIATGGSAEDFAALSGDLITTGQTLQTQITSNDSDISALTSNLVTTGQTLITDINTVSTNLISTGAIVDDISGNLITTGQTLQTQITSNDGDITTLTSNLITTGQTLTSEIGTVSGLITDNDAEITALLAATGELKTDTNRNASNLITTGQTLTTNINTVSTNLVSTGSIVDDISGNLITTGQTLQTQITSNDGDITNLTSNLITTGQTLTTEITTVSGLITDNDGDITALKAATGVLKTSTDNNTANLISTGSIVDDISGNLITTGQTLQTQITSNDSDISTLTSNLVTTGQTLTTNINTVSSNLVSTGSVVDNISGNLITTGQTLQTQITSNDGDISTLTTNLGTTGQTLQTQITSNDADIATLDSTTVKLTTNQSVAGNKIFTDTVTINNLTVTGTEVIVDVENLAVKDNIIHINSGESGAGISRISGGITIDRGTEPAANILYNDANDRFELNFPLATEGNLVASAANLITTGQTLQTQITSNDGDITTLTTNLGTTGQTLQTQITSNDSDISTLTSNLSTTNSNLVTTGQTLTTNINTVSTNLVSTGSIVDDISGNLITTGQTLQTQITSNDTDITNLSSNLVTTGQTLTTNINTVATNLVTTGQTLTSEIATVSGLIPATVIDGGGTANKVPLWSDANTIGDSVISQSSSKIGIGTATPSVPLHVAVDGTSEILLERTTNIAGMPSQIRIKSVGSEWSLANNLAGNGKFSIRDVTDSRHVMVFDGEGVVTTNKLEPLNGNDTGYLGSSSKKWKQVYFGILEADTATFSGALNFNNGSDNCLRIEADAGKDAYINSYGSGNFIQFKQNSAAVLSLYETFLAIPDSTQLRFGGGSDLRFYHDGNNSYIWQVGVGALNIKSSVTDGNIVFTADRGDGGGTFDYFSVNGGDTTYAGGVTTAYTKWADNSRIALGGGKDLQLYHDGSNSHIKNTGSLYVASETSGDLYLRSDDDIFIQPQGGENGITLTGNGAVTLYYDNAVKLATASTGVTVTGLLTSTTATFSGNITQTTGDLLYSGGGNWDIKHTGASQNIVFSTTPSGGSATERLRITHDGNLSFLNDTSKIKMGLGGDLQIYHDGGNSYISESGTGALVLQSNGTAIVLEKTDGENMILANTDGDVKLYYNGSEKLATTSTGITVTGAGTFSTSLKAATILDASNSAGTSGQILTSTGSALDWKTLGEISGVDGTGTAGYLSKWTDADTIANSVIVESSSKIGIGTATPDNLLTLRSSVQFQQDLKFTVGNTTVPGGFMGAGGASENIWMSAGAELTGSDNSASGFTARNNDGGGAGKAAGIRLGDSAGTITFFTASSLTNGNTFTWDGGSETGAVMSILNDGKVGIGTTSPAKTLELSNGTSNVAALRVARSTSLSDTYTELGTVGGSGRLEAFKGNVRIGADPDNNTSDSTIEFLTDNSVKMVIKSDGKVGIGTATPGAKLEVRGATETIPNLGTYGTFFNLRRTDGHIGLSIGIDSSTNHFWFQAQNSTSPIAQALILNPKGGSVGIGTTAPGAALEVAKTSADASLKVNRTDQTNIQLIAAGSSYVRASAALILQSNGANNRLTLATDGAATFSGTLTANDNININKADGIVYLNSAGTGNSGCYVRGLSGGAMRFQSQSYYEWEVTGNLKMKFTADGKLGIGTTAPLAKLHLKGGTATNEASHILFENTQGAKKFAIGGGGSGVTNNGLGFRNVTDNTLPMIIDDSGKVGIGVTAPVAKLHIDDSATGDNKGLYIQNTHNTDGDSAAIRFGFAGNDNANKGGIFFKRTANYGRGSLIFATENNQTNDNVDASDAKLTILADGKVGIGITSPDSLLQIANANGSSYRFGYGGTSDVYFDADDVYFRSDNGGVNNMLLKGSKLGIGTTAPGETLDVNGKIQIRGGNWLIFRNSNNSNYGSMRGASDTSNDVTINTNGEVIRFKQDGKVGIGTATPDAHKLTVVGGDDAEGTVHFHQNVATNNPTLYIQQVGEGGNAGNTTGLLIKCDGQNGGLSHLIRAIGTNSNVNSGTDVDAFVVRNDGKVGIGTTSPISLLDVFFTSSRRLLANYDDSLITLKASNNSSNPENLRLVADDIIFNTGTSGSGSERMRITDAGNVGIGTNAPAIMFDVKSSRTHNFIGRFVNTSTVGWGAYIEGGGDSADYSLLIRNQASSDLFAIMGNGEIRVANQTLVDSANTNYKMTFPDNSGIAMGSAYTFANIYGNAGNIYLRANAYPANTGSTSKIYLQTANSSGGQASDVVVNNGKVGIGNANPYFPLHVQGPTGFNGEAKNNALLFDTASATTGTGGGLAFGGYSNGTGGDIYHFGNIQGIKENSTAGNYASAMLFSTRANGATPLVRMRITSDGTLDLISAKFKINGSAGSAGQTLTTDGSGNISWSSAGSGTISGSGTDNYIPRWNGTAALQDSSMIALDDGRVGVGVASPSAIFHVKKTDSSAYWLGKFEADGTTQNALVCSTDTTSGVGVRFDMGGGSGTFTVLNSGKVGIGTTAPDMPLVVKTTAAIQTMKLNGHHTGYGSSLQFDATDAGGLNFELVSGGSGTGGSMNSKFSIRDVANNAPRLTIDSVGNVGIGIATPSERLHIAESTSGSASIRITNSTTGTGSSSGLRVSLEADENTTIMNHSNTNLNLGVNGLNVISIKDAKVGIGTTAPSRPLSVHMSSAGSIANFLHYTDASNFQGLYIDVSQATDIVTLNNSGSHGGAAIDLQVSSASVMYLQGSGGKVGIGTDAPASNQKLDVMFADNINGAGVTFRNDDGSLQFQNVAGSGEQFNPQIKGNSKHTNNVGLRLLGNAASGEDSGTTPLILLRGTVNNAKATTRPVLHVEDGAGDKLVAVAADGKVGIGTNAPSVHLDVYTAVGWGVVDIDGASGGELRFQRAGTTHLSIFANHSGSLGSNIKAESHLYLATNNSATPTMTLTSAYKVGIGTTAPTSKLTVVGGQVEVKGSNDTAALTGMLVKTSSSSSQGLFMVEGSGTGSLTGSIARATMLSSTASGTALQLGSAGVIRATIDSVGDVGIGTATPGSYDSRAERLVVHESGDGGVTIATGATSDGRLVFARSGDTGLDHGEISYDQNTDYMGFATAGSRRVTIDNSGKVGINKTPNSAVTLSVNAPASNTTNYGLEICNASANTRFLVDGVGNTSFYGSDNSLSVRVTSDGKVGIGTNAPGAALDVRTTTVGGGIFDIQEAATAITSGYKALSLSNSNATVGNHTAINFSDTVGGSSTAIISAKCNDHTNNYGDLQFWTRGATGYGTRLHIDQEGSVGIGTTAPSNLLSIHWAAGGYAKLAYATNQYAGLVFVENGVSKAYIDYGGYQATDGFSFYAGGGSNAHLAMKIKESGKTIIGGGATEPGACRLTVNGSGGFGSSSDGVIISNESGYGVIQGTDMLGNSFNGLKLRTQGYAIIIPNSAAPDVEIVNKLGIGVVAPQAKTDIVEIYADSSSAVEGLQLLIRGGQADLTPTGDSIGLGFGYGSANNYVKTGIINEFTAANGTSSLHLCTTATGGVATVTKADARLTVKSDGNVGIGTSAPSRLFNVYSGSDDTAWIRASYGTTTMCEIGAHSAAAYLQSGSGDDIRIAPAGSTKLIVKVDGNVGIGTTTPLARLHVREASAGSFTYDGTADTLIVESNANGGITIATAAANTGRIIFASPNDPTGAEIKYSDATSLMTIGTTTPNDHLVLQAGNGVEAVRVQSDGNVGIGSASPAAPLDVPRASDYKVIKLGDDITSHYVMTGNSDHTLTLTCASYFQAEIVITAHQTNGGTYNNLYMRGIWSNNHTSHHWDEIENVGSLTNSTFTITVGQNGGTTNSGEWKIVHDYVSGTFVKFTVRVTDFYGTHAYTIS